MIHQTRQLANIDASSVYNLPSVTRSSIIMAEPLQKVDSAVAGLPTEKPVKEKKSKKDNGVMNIDDLGMFSFMFTTSYLLTPG